ncbi:precorrin-6y C5,15-methyltransferase (decarboxylating) subunit CbiE [Pseudonocardia humida]|uniref:Precorrin-6y C5,15-methyltransferase (Decarboxylating) subunit CbiE n=1 Tax=Pseudonocardia humida TaxID=2800819 RepID=A0ABT1AA33_9PSEU|nr:precorrin-6y C5,15-methyltransferase (decarboxylating) subunit CbiE [Pseudonocardia humida]MCO1659816.1 precorrin-6y C5,15-methyltransferase (decarboxylating) subunit CbiE [Pseudonocardia humida]
MTAPVEAAAARVTVVGIGADGWAGLAEPGRAALRDAEVVLGGPRQLALVAGRTRAEARPWPSPMLPALPELFAGLRGRRVCALASGDPMLHGLGTTLTRVLGAAAVDVLSHPSSVSLACARLGWAVDSVEVVSAVGRPLAALRRVLAPGARLLVLSEGPATPGEVAALLAADGWADSALAVFEQLGGPAERRLDGTAGAWAHPPGDPLNLVAVQCAAGPDARPRAVTPGLPDDAYDHDGQLTKREVRAVTLALLGPRPGELLWDVGAGNGSIAVEWSRAHPTCRAVAVEPDPARAARITANADALGVPGVRVVTGRAPDALDGLPDPDAVFIGGGLTAEGVPARCWDALRPGGRLVANAVTVESEGVLAAARSRHGGELTRLSVARAAPVGGFTGWRPAMPVTIWSVTKPMGTSG